MAECAIRVLGDTWATCLADSNDTVPNGPVRLNVGVGRNFYNVLTTHRPPPAVNPPLVLRP